jgi:hypothetical protein
MFTFPDFMFNNFKESDLGKHGVLRIKRPCFDKR